MEKECWAFKYCRKKYNVGCNQFCGGYVLLDIAYKQSNIPLKYQFPTEFKIDSIDKDAFNEVGVIISDSLNWVNAGESLMLWGEKKGNGKTSLACAIANAYLRKKVFEEITDPLVYFIKTSKFLEDMRSHYSDPSDNFKRVIKLVEIVPLLIIDDIGAEKPTDWVRERLLSIIDERYSNNRSTIYTSNCTLQTIHENLHGRIADRLKDCKLIHIQGNSRRGNN